MILSDNWRAAVADDALRRVAAEPDYDDSAWAPVDVPGHWRSSEAFAAEDGSLVYRTRFASPTPDDHTRHWLVFDGIFYQGDVWCDGTYLGDTEGYFVPHEFEVTSLLAARSEHVVAVEVACGRPSELKAKRNITGVFQHWDCIDPAWNPGGIWRPVRLVRSGPVRMSGLSVRCTEADARRATVVVRADLQADTSRAVTITTAIGGRVDEQEQQLAAGVNRVEWTVRIDDPVLWWPWALGDQPLHDVVVTVATDEGRSDEASTTIGLRQISMQNWVTSVNGERLFLKGTNLAPTRMALAEATPEEFARDIALAKDAGLDLVRVHAHVSRPELYDAADRAGMLVWQDFPLQWGYARTIRKQASRQARAMVELLGHHPSIALWCGHNEPIAFGADTGVATKEQRKSTRRAHLLAQQLPSWNRSVLDRAVKRSMHKADDSRPAVAHSGIQPHLPQLDGTDSHLYFGWYGGDERELADFCRRWPRMARFVSEFGAQAVPESAEFMDAEAWPDLDWERLGTTHGLQKSMFDRVVAPASYPTFDQWREATQAYQASLIKHAVETLRRIKYRPTGGFCQFALTDAHPAVSWSVLDHRRVAKAGYHALSDACRPVIVVADRLPATVAPGDPIALDVHAVSDLRVPCAEVTVSATMSWTNGRHSWRWTGDLDADCVVRVGTISFVAPAAVGPLILELELVAETVAASNRYESTITAS